MVLWLVVLSWRMAQPAVLTHLLPSLIPPGVLANAQAVILDIVRASTTVCSAMHAGAAGVRIAADLDEARAIRAATTTPAVLGGERAGERPEGFDLGNSPGDYTPASVDGKLVVFSTTNGTKAAIAARSAARVVFGCFANVAAIAADLASDGRTVHLVCAGTDDKVSQEDALAAGAIADRLLATGYIAANDQALIARGAWLAARQAVSLAAVLRQGAGGQNLIRIGLGADIDRCAQPDWCTIVPELDVPTMTVRPASREAV
jgi:2-phosphosulfolactate phosphatase